MSAPDYPLWPKLVSSLLEACGVRPEDLAPDATETDLAEAAKLKNENAYYATLDDTFGRPRPMDLSVLRKYHLLARANFAFYINLNFDPRLIETLDLQRNGRFGVSDFPSDLSAVGVEPNECFHLHGRLNPDRPARLTKIVLTASEFKSAYDPLKTMVFSFVQQVFMKRDVCFVGCNPSEPYMRRILEACSAFCDGKYGLNVPGRPNWYLLWDDGTAEPDVAKTGIHLVRYPRTDNAFVGLENVLGDWAERRPIRYRSRKETTSQFDHETEPQK
jgi:hypothetical protein